MHLSGRRAVFLDRDGTIIYDPGYLRDPDEVRLLPQAGPSLARLQSYGLLLILASNQSAVGRGMLSTKQLGLIQERLEQCLAEYGVHFDGVFYCPHAPWERCLCRKPLPGLFLQAVETLGVDLKTSYMVGDKTSDVEAGKAVSCRTILLTAAQDNAPRTDSQECRPDIVARSWTDVVHYIGREVS